MKYLYKGQIVTASTRNEAVEIFASRGAKLSERTPDRFDEDSLTKKNLIRKAAVEIKKILKRYDSKFKGIDVNTEYSDKKNFELNFTFIGDVSEKSVELIEMLSKGISQYKCDVINLGDKIKLYIEDTHHNNTGDSRLWEVINSFVNSTFGKQILSLHKHFKKVILELVIPKYETEIIMDEQRREMQIADEKHEAKEWKSKLNGKIPGVSKIHVNERKHKDSALAAFVIDLSEAIKAWNNDEEDLEAYVIDELLDEWDNVYKIDNTKICVIYDPDIDDFTIEQLIKVVKDTGIAVYQAVYERMRENDLEEHDINMELWIEDYK